MWWKFVTTLKVLQLKEDSDKISEDLKQIFALTSQHHMINLAYIVLARKQNIICQTRILKARCDALSITLASFVGENSIDSVLYNLV
jgi:hypothetical protein